MPAIRYNFGAITPLATSNPGDSEHPIEVSGRGGEPRCVRWMGFICLTGTHYIEGKTGKIFAFEVTNGPGQYAGQGDWRPVRKDERVLGWIVSYSKSDSRFGVYGIVDQDGWPIIIKDKLPPGPKPKAEVKRLVPRLKDASVGS